MNDLEARGRGKGELRPGAMTAVMRAAATTSEGPRWLRWAWIEGGRIVRDEVRAPERPLTVGPRGDIAAGGVDGVVARFERGRWILRVAPEWRGRLGEGPIEELPSRRSADGWRELELGDRARGRVEMEGGALLIQLVPRPAGRARAALPSSVRMGILERTDWRFTAFVTASFCAHFALVVGLMEADWPVESPLAATARIAQVYYVDPPPPDDPPPVDEGEGPIAEGDDAEVEGPVADDAPTRPRRPSRPAPRSDPQATLADATAAVQGVQLALGTLLATEGSAVANLLENGAPTEDQASIMASVDGTRVVAAAGPNVPMAERRGGDGPGFEPGLPGLDRGRIARSGRVREGGELEEVVVTRVRPPVLDEFDPLGPPDWDPRELHQMLGRRMRAVQRCYEHELTRGTITGGGRITLALRVMPVGTMSGVRATENSTGSDALAECAVRSVRNLRLRVGPSEPVEVRYPVVFSRVE